MTGTATGTRAFFADVERHGNARERSQLSAQVDDGNATGTHGNGAHGNAEHPPFRGVPVPGMSPMGDTSAATSAPLTQPYIWVRKG